MNYDLFKKRYWGLLEERGISERQLMAEAGLPRDKIRSFLVRGKVPNDCEAVSRISKILEVNPFYLLEPMGITPDLFAGPYDPNISGDVIYEESERALINMFRGLDEPQKRLILNMFRNAVVGTDRAVV